MTRRIISILTLSLPLLISGCFLWGDDQQMDEDLDISAEKAAANALKPKKEIIHWQKFFKAPPTAKQMSLLQSKAKKWPSTNDPRQLTEKARTEMIVGEMDAAEATFRKLIRIEPHNLMAHVELAQLYLKTNNLERCFSYLRRSKELLADQEANKKEEVFQYRYTLALALIRQNNIKKGYTILSELISKDKTFAPAYAALASSYFNRGKVEVAEFIAKRGLDRGKEDPRLTNLLGVISFHKGHIVEAKRWYDRALKQSPNFVPALTNRGNLSIFRGEYESADLDLRLAIKLNPSRSEAYIILGILQQKKGQYQQARGSYLKAIDLDPENGFARYNLGLLEAEAFQNKGEALRLFNEVLQVRQAENQLRDLAKLNIEQLQENRVEYQQ